MKKKVLVAIILVLVMLTPISCSHNKNSSQVSVSGNSTAGDNAGYSVDLVTKNDYKVNDEIVIGDNSDIIAKQGEFTDKVYQHAFFLGADGNGNIITFNSDTNNIESIDSHACLSVVMNIMEGRKNHVYTIKKLGDIVVWDECPHGDQDPATDPTNGSDWVMYFADLKTKAITKIDEYEKGVVVPKLAQDGYLCPDQIYVAPNYVSYATFNFNPAGKVTGVVKLYSISTHQLEILDYLIEDLTKYSFASPNVSGEKMVWSKVLLDPDGTYSGCSYLYDLKTKIKSKLVTDENMIFPLISDNYIYTQGEPNKTFYDTEVCIYDISKNTWVYKINNGYSPYKPHKDVYLAGLETSGKYLLWSSGINYGLTIFDQEDNKLYNLAPVPNHVETDEIRGPQLLDGNLLIWHDLKYGSNEDDRVSYKYIFLK